MASLVKLYLAEFVPWDKSKPHFHKFGITHHLDALNRFINDPQYDSWEVRIVASATGTFAQVENAERELQKRFPKNFWLTEKISGVTEIVKLDYKEIREAFRLMDQYKTTWSAKKDSF